MSSLQFHSIAIAVPDLMIDLDASLRWVGWVIAGFSLAQAVGMPIAGRLSDDRGRRTIFLGGLVLFISSSLLCAVSPSIAVLIAGRALQGLAAGILVPSAYGIVGDAFVNDRVRAIGLLSSVFALGQIAGPNLGAVVIAQWGWRATFLIPVPIGLVAVGWALLRMPGEPPRVRRPFNPTGAALLVLSSTAFLLALTELSKRDGSVDGRLALGAAAASVFGFVLLVRSERVSRNPIMDRDLVRRRGFVAIVTLELLYGAVFFGSLSFIPLYAVEAYGMSPAQTGLLMTPRAVVLLLASAIASILLVRFGFRRPIGAGLIVMAVALGVLALGLGPDEGHHWGWYLYLSAVVSLTGLALGVSNPATINTAIELDPERVALLTGLRGMFRLLGAAVGTSVVVLIASRASSAVEGLERSFLGISLVTLLALFLVPHLPNGQKAGARTAVAGRGSGDGQDGAKELSRD
jgi:EmrB/QacA subfamily drug resistance transporter